MKYQTEQNRSALYCAVALLLLVVGAACNAQTSAMLSAEAQSVIPEQVSASGRVVTLAIAKVSPRIAGTLATLGQDEAGRPLDTGMKVRKGQTLFRLDQTTMQNAVTMAEASLSLSKAGLANLKAPPREEKVVQLESAIAELSARLADRQREEDRYKRLVEVEKTLPLRRLEEVQTEVATLSVLKAAAQARLREAKTGPTPTEVAVAEAQVAQAAAALKSAKDDLRDSAVIAPFDGTITARLHSAGDYIPSGTEVMSLVSADSLEAELKLPETYLPSVEAGRTTATLRSPLLTQELRVPVSRVVDSVDAGKGTFTVRVAIPSEKQGRLAPGAFITASVELSGKRQGHIIPQRAVRIDAGKSYVLVAEEGKLKRLEVQPGERMTETVVVSGLSDAQRVYFGPADTVKEGASVQ